MTWGVVSIILMHHNLWSERQPVQDDFLLYTSIEPNSAYLQAMIWRVFLRWASFFFTAASRPRFTTRSQSSTTFDKCELETPIKNKFQQSGSNLLVSFLTSALNLASFFSIFLWIFFRTHRPALHHYLAAYTERAEPTFRPSQARTGILGRPWIWVVRGRKENPPSTLTANLH